MAGGGEKAAVSVCGMSRGGPTYLHVCGLAGMVFAGMGGHTAERGDAAESGKVRCGSMQLSGDEYYLEIARAVLSRMWGVDAGCMTKNW